MTLKQFLKPDWRKIVIFVVFFIYGTFTIFMSESLIYCLQFYSEIFNDSPKFLTPLFIIFREDAVLSIFTSFVDCEFILNVFDSTMLMLFYSEYVFIPLCFPYIISIFLYSLMIPSPYVFCIIYWYLLSCLIVWIYDKVKKKKR